MSSLFTFVAAQSPDKLMLFAAGLIALLLVSRWYWGRKIEAWARGEGLKLISYRGAWFGEGPGRFLRSKNQHVFRVEVEDREGIRRTAYLQFGTYWGFTWGSPLTKVQFTDDDAY